MAYFNSGLSLDKMIPMLKEIMIGHGWKTCTKEPFFELDSYEYLHGEMDYGVKVEIKHWPPWSPIIHPENYVLELKIYCKGEDRDETLKKVSRIIDNLEKKL